MNISNFYLYKFFQKLCACSTCEVNYTANTLKREFQ